MALDKSTGSDGQLKCALTVANGFAPQPPHQKSVKVNKDQVTTSKLISKLTSIPNDNDSEKAPVNTSNDTAIVGISHASIHHRAVCEKLLQGTLTVNATRWKNFVTKIQEFNQAAGLDVNNPLEVCHSDCGKWIKLGALCEIRCFEDHHHVCHNKSLTLHGTQHLLTKWVTQNPPLRNLSAKIVKPCLGLQISRYPKIENYLSVVCQTVGGGKALYKLASQEFGIWYSELDDEQKLDIDQLHENSKQWQIDHGRKLIFSKWCLQQVEVEKDADQPPEHHPPCEKCIELSQDASFSHALNWRGAQNPDNMKYTNTRFLNTSLTKRYAETKGLSELMEPVSLFVGT